MDQACVLDLAAIVTDTRTHLVRATLNALAQRFAHLGFVRVHRQVIVNRRWVRHVWRKSNGRLMVHLHDASAVALRRRYAEAQRKLR